MNVILRAVQNKVTVSNNKQEKIKVHLGNLSALNFLRALQLEVLKVPK